MYKKDIADKSSNEAQYVNLFDYKDSVVQDALSIVSYDTLNKATELFGDNTFMVRKDLLNDTLGYRSASVGDAWTGNSRWSKETQDNVRRLFISAMGNSAYKVLMNSENTIQNLVKDAKTLIVVKSMIVPAINFMSNIYQMIGRGVPLKDMVTGLPKKTNEIHQYTKSRLRQIEAEAELRATEEPNKRRRLEAEIRSITDAHRRLSVWPLIERGEFASIADAGIGRDDILITEGKIQQYFEAQINKLPENVRTMGRYFAITKDTALFQGIQKAVEYSDFIAKAIIYDDLTKRKGVSKEDALGRVTEEFVNYDRLPGRFRGYMESMGLMWFYNFKIRSSKVAVSMIRNNPLHSLMAGMLPTHTMIGNVGLPIQDNMFSMLAEDKLGYSLGFGQGARAPNLNPWHNLVF